jgi:GMP synthase (glutamine-hydrolysing)
MTAPASSIGTTRLLLVQARNTAEMELQEQTCFVERCQISKRQLRTVNVVRDSLSPRLLDEVDALMIGGAGEYSALADPAWMPPLLELVRTAVDQSLPTFGSCWGHQIIARALGGRLAHDSERAELGCHAVALTDAGRRDELFGRFPDRFQANMGHHDRVVELPPDGIELARNDSQPFQAFRIDGKPVYGTQFHSELDAQRERERLLAYRDFYRSDLPDEKDFAMVLDALAETSEVDGLLRDFLDTFVLAPSATDRAPSTDGAPSDRSPTKSGSTEQSAVTEPSSASDGIPDAAGDEASH